MFDDGEYECKKNVSIKCQDFGSSCATFLFYFCKIAENGHARDAINWLFYYCLLVIFICFCQVSSGVCRYAEKLNERRNPLNLKTTFSANLISSRKCSWILLLCYFILWAHKCVMPIKILIGANVKIICRTCCSKCICVHDVNGCHCNKLITADALPNV